MSSFVCRVFSEDFSMTSKLSVNLVSAVYLPGQALRGTVHIRNTPVIAGAHIQLRVIGTESVTLFFPPNLSCVTILDELMTIHSFRQPLTQLCVLSIPFSFTLPPSNHAPWINLPFPTPRCQCGRDLQGVCSFD